MFSADRPLPPEFAREAQALDSPRCRSSASTAWCRRHAAATRCSPTSRPLAPAIRCAARSRSSLRPPPRACPRGACRGAAKRGSMRGSRRGCVSASRALRLRSARRRSRLRPSCSRSPKSPAALLSLGPRLLINLDDVPATNLLQPGNRATYRLLVAGDAIDAYRDVGLAASGARAAAGIDPRPAARDPANPRARGQIPRLASLVAVILAAVAVALAASRYLRRHLDAAAMMRCFGAPQRQTLGLFVIQFGVLGLVASAVGTLVALGGQQLLVSLLGSVIHADLPLPGVLPAARRWSPAWRCCSVSRCRR